MAVPVLPWLPKLANWQAILPVISCPASCLAECRHLEKTGLILGQDSKQQNPSIVHRFWMRMRSLNVIQWSGLNTIFASSVFNTTSSCVIFLLLSTCMIGTVWMPASLARIMLVVFLRSLGCCLLACSLAFCAAFILLWTNLKFNGRSIVFPWKRPQAFLLMTRAYKQEICEPLLKHKSAIQKHTISSNLACLDEDWACLCFLSLCSSTWDISCLSWILGAVFSFWRCLWELYCPMPTGLHWWMSSNFDWLHLWSSAEHHTLMPRAVMEIWLGPSDYLLQQTYLFMAEGPPIAAKA